MATVLNMEGKTALVTGATDGLGRLVARDLAVAGATVLVHGRDKAKGGALVHELQRGTGNDRIHYYNADYTSLYEVRDMAIEIANGHDRIDLLINNAAIGAGRKEGGMREVYSGIEARFLVNYLAHVLLTELLLPVIGVGKEEGEGVLVLSGGWAGIINVASVGQAPVEFADIMFEHRAYDGFGAYRQSKTALIMYTMDLADRLKGKGVMVNAVHPSSLMNTKMVMDDWGYSRTTVEEGAAAVEKAIGIATSGDYYDVQRKARAIEQVYEPSAREMLRDVTGRLLGPWLS